MTLRVEAIPGEFVARVRGINLNEDMNAEHFSTMRRALDEHSILVFSSQPMSDEQQMKFSRWWGPMEPTKGVNPASGTPFARQSNLDVNDGSIIAAQDRRIDYQRGNYLWHADSTFKPVPSLCSILTAREVPPEGGNTQFVSTRGAFERLSPERKNALAALIVEHDFNVSRARVGFTFTPEEAALTPPVWHPLVQTNPVTQRKSLLIGAHASHIVGWPRAKGEALLSELLDFATQPASVYSHRWLRDDIAIWDNRSVLHRATAYDSQQHRRLMQRTTIGNPDILLTAAYERVRCLRKDRESA